MASRQILAISGSLRTASSNTSLLLAAQCLAPPGLRIELFGGMGALPHFNPDLEADLPALVAALRATVDAADGLLISCPEYARGMPGSFKNLLDWLVGSPNFHAKPVAIFNASSRASEAQRSLRLVLTTMSNTSIFLQSCWPERAFAKASAVGMVSLISRAPALELIEYFYSIN